MNRAVRLLLLAVLVVALVAAVGCKEEPRPAPKPLLAPPVIGTAGTLRVGVDLSTPPFGGTDNGRRAGIDLDVAAAVADQLNLKVAYIDVPPSQAASAVAEGKVDMVMSVSIAEADLSAIAVAGTYLANGPAFFMAAEGTATTVPTMTLETVPVEGVAAQSESPAFWLLGSELGSEAVKPFDSLREALESVDRGDNEVAAGDAFVGAYIARDLPRIRFAGQLAPASPLAVGVATENGILADKVRGILDSLAADGLLDSIRKKWVGDLPELSTADESATVDSE